MADKDFVSEWRNRGDKEAQNADKNGWVFAFFCYFIAFNYLYNQEQTGSDHKKIEAFIEGSSATIEFTKNHDIQKEFIQPTSYNEIVLDDRPSDNKHKKYFDMFRDIFAPTCEYSHFKTYIQEKKTVTNFFNEGIFKKECMSIFLFFSIYQVRCNLFHGNKCMSDTRNRDLIKDGAIILNFFLKEWLKTN